MKVGKNMSNELIQIYIDPDIEKQANDLFNRLGLDMSSAVNAFLNQCVLYGKTSSLFAQKKGPTEYIMSFR